MGDWLKEQTSIHMVVSDAVAYAEDWKAWWINCQPSARAEAPWPFPHEPKAGTQWGRLLNGGKHGIFLFVMALSWWAKSLDPTVGSPDLATAVRDLDWVVRQLTEDLTILPPSPAFTPTPEEQASRSKRKIILTEKVLSAGENVQKRYRR